MALTYLNSQMIEIPATLETASIINLSANNIIVDNINYTNFTSPLFDNVELWNSTYTTVLNNSATTWSYQGTDLKILSANWENTYLTVFSNLINWNYQGTDLKELSSNWESTYTIFSSISSQIALSGDVIPAVLENLQTNQINISGVTTTQLILLSTQTTPSLSTDEGVKGSIKWDSNYLYICIEDDIWKRVALTAW